MLTGLLSLTSRRFLTPCLAGMLVMVPLPALALGEDLQCVPYARQLSGIQIYGDAHTWWPQAAGRYDRGNRPKVGAVLAFRPHGKMKLGHVAAVSALIDSRTILVSHSNWSTINGTRGHIENNVRVIDVSERNDWSEVRVWYTPNRAMGGTRWPTYGFIYADKAPRGAPVMIAEAKPAPRPTPKAAAPVPARSVPARKPARDLLAAIDGDWVKRVAATEKQAIRQGKSPAPTSAARPASHSQTPSVSVASANASSTTPSYRTQNLPAGYTPSVYARTAYGEPGNIGELLARY